MPRVIDLFSKHRSKPKAVNRLLFSFQTEVPVQSIRGRTGTFGGEKTNSTMNCFRDVF